MRPYHLEEVCKASLVKAELSPLRRISLLSAVDTRLAERAPTAFIFFCCTVLSNKQDSQAS